MIKTKKSSFTGYSQEYIQYELKITRLWDRVSKSEILLSQFKELLDFLFDQEIIHGTQISHGDYLWFCGVKFATQKGEVLFLFPHSRGNGSDRRIEIHADGTSKEEVKRIRDLLYISIELLLQAIQEKIHK